jgi:hypothetical protein
MAREFKLQGDTEQQKMEHAEVVIGRLLSRPAPSIQVAIPPTLVFQYSSAVKEDGLIGRWICPVSGIIKTVYLFAGQLAEKIQPVLTMIVKNGKNLQSIEENYRVGANTFEPGLIITPGGMIELHTTDPLSVFELSVGIFIETRLSAATKEQILLEETTNAGATEGAEVK